MKPTLAFIGAGRLGNALARRFFAVGYTITGIYSRHIESAQSLAREVNSHALDTYPNADIILLTVPDDAIQEVTNSLAPYSPTGAVVHTSGVHSLDSLHALTTCEIGSFHPLYPFRDGSRLAGNEQMLIAVEASSHTLEQQLIRMAEDIGGRPAVVHKKTQYHAAASIASNFLVTLFEVALNLMTDAGIPKELARDALVKLMQGNLDNLAILDPSEALTGPIARGDTSTIQAHMDVLHDGSHDYTNLYRELGRLTVQLAPKLDDETRQRLYNILAWQNKA